MNQRLRDGLSKPDEADRPGPRLSIIGRLASLVFFSVLGAWLANVGARVQASHEHEDLQGATPSTDEKSWSQRLWRNGAALFALGGAFIAAALPAAEFVKGIYELRVKEREHADQIELEFMKLLSNSTTQKPDRRRILDVLSADKSESPLKKWAIKEAKVMDNEDSERAQLDKRVFDDLQEQDATRRAHAVILYQITSMKAELTQLDRTGSDLPRQRELVKQIAQLQSQDQILQVTVASIKVVPISKGDPSPKPTPVGAETVGEAVSSCLYFERLDFKGRAALLNSKDVDEVAVSLGVEVPTLYAMMSVMSSMDGYRDGRPTALFERTIFQRRTGGKFAQTNPDISSEIPGGYRVGASEYERIKQAMSLDCKAALESTSWGLFQIMGFQWKEAGFDSVTDMVLSEMDSETAQLQEFARWVRSKPPLLDAMRNKDWQKVAFSFAGPLFRNNSYDAKLASAYSLYKTRFSADLAPDDEVEKAQRNLAILGLFVGAPNGRYGEDLFWAIRNFQAGHGIIPDGWPGRVTTTKLEACASHSPSCGGA